MVSSALWQSAHWECKFRPMTDGERREFLRSLPPWKANQAPWGLLLELDLFDFVDEMVREDLR
jgi:hypothetical protein